MSTLEAENEQSKRRERDVAKEVDTWRQKFALLEQENVQLRLLKGTIED